MSLQLPEARERSAAPAPLEVLREVFGYEHFRGTQAEVMAHVVAGGDALVLMPTGGGKSLCYQVPAIVRHPAIRMRNTETLRRLAYVAERRHTP